MGTAPRTVRRPGGQTALFACIVCSPAVIIDCLFFSAELLHQRRRERPERRSRVGSVLVGRALLPRRRRLVRVLEGSGERVTAGFAAAG